MIELIERWLRDCARSGRADRTIATYRERMATLARDHPARPVESLTRDEVQRWVDGRGGPASRAAHRSTATMFWRWLIEEGIASVNVAAACKTPTVWAGRPRPVDADGLAVAVTAAGAKMRAMLLLGALGGLRVAEMAALRWECVDITRAEMTVVRGKGGKDRVVPLASALETALLALGRRRSGPVLLARHGGGYTPREVSHAIGVHLRRHGVDATAHQLRHTFATAVYRATRDIHATAQLLGHANTATTAVYARFDIDGALRDRVRALSVA